MREAEDLRPGCVLLDVQLPDMSGIEVQSTLGGLGSSLPVILMSANGDPAGIMRAMHNGSVEFLEKPFDDDDLVAALGTGFAIIDGDLDADERGIRAQQSVARLTPVQIQVLRGVVAGMDNAEITTALDVTSIEVRRIRAQLVEQLDLKRPIDALILACAAKLSPLVSNAVGSGS